MTASWSSKTYNIALQPECVTLDVTWSILLRSRLVCVVGIWFRMFGFVCRQVHPWLSYMLGFVGLVWYGILQSPNPEDRNGNPIHALTCSREITSASVEMCDTGVCFLHTQLNGTKRLTSKKCTEFLVMLILSLQGLLQNQSLETILICIVVLCFLHSNIACIHMCDECKRSNALNVCHKLLPISWPHEQVCSQTIIYQVYQ